MRKPNLIEVAPTPIGETPGERPERTARPSRFDNHTAHLESRLAQATILINRQPLEFRLADLRRRRDEEG
jgi:hypothetical protein